MGTYDGKLFALDAATGDTKWEQGDAERRALAPDGDGRPGLRGRVLLLRLGGVALREDGRQDLTVAFNAHTGKEVWSFPNGKYASPIIADQDRVYLTGRSILYGLEPRKTKQRADGTASQQVQRANERKAKRKKRQRERN